MTVTTDTTVATEKALGRLYLDTYRTLGMEWDMSRDSYDSRDSGNRDPARARQPQLSTMTRRFAAMVLVSLVMWAILIWTACLVVSASEPSLTVERCVVEDLDR